MNINKDIYPFQPKRLKINDHSMSYIDEGKGPPVVMVHGNPTWSLLFRNLVTSLKNDYRTIAPDHIGCGLSDKPQEYGYRLLDHINNLERLIDHLGLKKFSLVMHDWGGAIGMGYAVRHPERIASLTLCNTSAFCSKRMPLRISLCRTPLLGPLLIRGANLFAGAAIHMAVKKPLDRRIADLYLAPYDSWQNRLAIMRFVEDIPMKPSHPSWQTLKNIEDNLALFNRTPVLLSWGAKDFCFTTHFMKRFQEIFPQAESRLFEKAGHYVFEDAHGKIEPAILDFLNRTVKKK